MRVFTFSEAGGHPVNEDAFRAEPHPDDASLWLVLMADGQGGRSGGARAACVAVEAALEAARHTPPPRLREQPAAWRAILHHADEAVMADPDAGFASLVGFAAADDAVLTGASCGDSAVLVATDGATQIVTDHQYKNPPCGSGEANFVPFHGAKSQRRSILAMTDGVWKYAGWDAVEEAACELHGQPLIDAIAGKARLPGSGGFPDDFTLLVLESDG
jgi:serine/threonine protein phosphatase PrpC